MLKLRKILLCNYFYYIVFLISIIQLFFRLNIPYTSKYSIHSTSFTGIVEDIIIKDDKVSITLKNNEKVIGSYFLKENEKIPKIELGDKIKITGEFKRLSSNTTDYLFNYQKYYKRRKIFYFVEIDSIIIINKNKSFYYYLKQQCINRLQHPYLKTFIMGDKRYLDEKIKRSYQENGISHLFAISGMHITLLVNLIGKILKKIRINEKNIFYFTMLFLLFYLSLIGPSPSVVRGIMFYFFFTINNLYYFYIKPIHLFLLIISISLFINPNYIFETGYIYSYTISFTLISLSKELQSKSYFKSLLKVSIYAFIVSIPVTIYFFYQINVLGIIYNLFFVPFVSLIVFPMSLIVAFVTPLEGFYSILIIILEKTSLFLANITIGKLIFKRVSVSVYLLYVILLFGYIFTKNKKLIVLFFLLLIIHYSLPFIDSREYLKMIDIGQGDSILLHSYNKNILVDTGGYESFGTSRDGNIYFHTLGPLFKSEGIHSLDYLILTHGDKDHLGEAQTIIENMKVEKIIINDNKRNYYEKQLPRDKIKVGKQGLYLHANHIKMWQLNEDLEDENDSSQIYYVLWNNKSLLLTGDASIRSEKSLLDNYDLGHIDILKAGHHGSKTSTSEELLKEITPGLVLISCGMDNKFKHPNIETIEKLKKFSIPYYRTDQDGSITIDMKSKTWNIKTCPP